MLDRLGRAYGLRPSAFVGGLGEFGSLSLDVHAYLEGERSGSGNNFPR